MFIQERDIQEKLISVLLPMIDHNPSDLSCMYSTLLCVCSEASRCRKKAIVTFDQPLYWKCQIIINSEPTDSPLKYLILLLGGFHVRVSFLSSIGNIMEGSGFGKAVSRAIRAHFMMGLALNLLALCEAHGFNIDDENIEDKILVFQCAEVLYEEIKTVETWKNSVNSRTPHLWFQYMEIVSILRSFLMAEKTGDWPMHLKCLWRMMPFLAAAGHNHYTK
ncbi:hypothetical protein PR048_006095 [Dryococelus australis]|uniref:Uncharacterized protein n=1 Tax=Dryococelus australis TaxID=614101 RepID=A0ABQ9IAK9_9NEOP|nr:hypothetical protein PR048_006095 [Dryococelus australis]